MCQAATTELLCVSVLECQKRKREGVRERMSEWWKWGWVGERGRETAFITRKLSEDFMAVKFRRQRPILLVNIGCRELERWEERIVQLLEQIVMGVQGRKKLTFSHLCSGIIFNIFRAWHSGKCFSKGWTTRMQRNVQFWYKLYDRGTPQKTLYSWPSRRNFRMRTAF
jgi:hypothetical protein